MDIWTLRAFTCSVFGGYEIPQNQMNSFEPNSFILCVKLPRFSRILKPMYSSRASRWLCPRVQPDGLLWMQELYGVNDLTQFGSLNL